MTTTERYLRVPDAAEIAGVRENTIRRWLREGTLAGVKPGGDKSGYRITPEALAALMHSGGRAQTHYRRAEPDSDARYLPLAAWARQNGLAPRTVWLWAAGADVEALKSAGVLTSPNAKQRRLMVPRDMTPDEFIDAVKAAKSAA